MGDRPYIRCEILVERESQKGIVIGKGGLVLKEVGTAVRAQLPRGAFVELFVKVDKDWQRRPKSTASATDAGFLGVSGLQRPGNAKNFSSRRRR